MNQTNKQTNNNSENKTFKKQEFQMTKSIT